MSDNQSPNSSSSPNTSEPGKYDKWLKWFNKALNWLIGLSLFYALMSYFIVDYIYPYFGLVYKVNLELSPNKTHGECEGKKYKIILKLSTNKKTGTINYTLKNLTDKTTLIENAYIRITTDTLYNKIIEEFAFEKMSTILVECTSEDDNIIAKTLRFFIREKNIDDALKPNKSQITFDCIDLGEYSDMSAIDITEDEKIKHPNINNFYIDKREVNANDYSNFTNQIIGTNLYTLPQESSADYKSTSAEYPAVGISFIEAQCYCSKIGKRLPTEDEWDLIDNRINKGAYELKIKSFKELESESDNLNIYGFKGNAYEWCDILSIKYKVVKGLASFPESKRKNRFLLKPDIRQDTIGFRCVKDLPQYRKNKNIDIDCN